MPNEFFFAANLFHAAGAGCASQSASRVPKSYTGGERPGGGQVETQHKGIQRGVIDHELDWWYVNFQGPNQHPRRWQHINARSHGCQMLPANSLTQWHSEPNHCRWTILMSLPNTCCNQSQCQVHWGLQNGSRSRPVWVQAGTTLMMINQNEFGPLHVNFGTPKQWTARSDLFGMV